MSDVIQQSNSLSAWVNQLRLWLGCNLLACFYWHASWAISNRLQYLVARAVAAKQQWNSVFVFLPTHDTLECSGLLRTTPASSQWRACVRAPTTARTIGSANSASQFGNETHASSTQQSIQYLTYSLSNGLKPIHQILNQAIWQKNWNSVSSI